MNKLILIKNKPEIDFSKMELLAKEVQNKMSKIDFENIVVTEENVKDTKKLRTSIRKEFNQLEEARKDFEKAYREPLEAFKEFYDKEIAKIYKSADSQLRTLIVEIEDKQRQEKEEEVRKYFEELKEVENLDFLEYERLNIKVNLSSSINKLKEEVSDKVDQIKADLDLIDTQEHKERILVLYHETLDVNSSITKVLKQVEQEKALQMKLAEEKAEEQEVVEEVSETVKVLSKPKVVEEEYSMTFTVSGTLEELKSVKSFLEQNNIKYQSV